MVDKSKISRICFIDPDGVPIRIIFRVPKDVVAGGVIRLYEEGIQRPIKSFKIGAKDNENSAQTLTYSIQKLEHHVLIWHILACSLNPKLSETEIAIDFFQGDAKCKVNIPTTKKITNLTPCSVKNHYYYTQSLYFLRTEKKASP
jgi:hypothetical protein